MDVELQAGCELRVEVPLHEKVKFVVSEGTAEENGQELLLGKWYTVKDEPFFIFTYTGCKIKLAPNKAFSYVSEESNIPYIYNVFEYLRFAKKKIVLVVGEGRNTLTNILSNYYVRNDEKVLHVNLDVHSSGIMVPGSLCSTVIQEVYSHVGLLGSADKTCHFYGSQSASDNPDLYRLLLEEALITAQKREFPGPTIITGSKEFYQPEIEKVRETYPAACVIIIGNEKLYHQIATDDKIYVPSFPGLAARDTQRKRMQLTSRIKGYFHGEQDEYTPCTVTVKIRTEESGTEEEDRHRLVQVGDEYMAPMSALPLGSSRRKNSTSVIDVAPVERSLLAVSSAERVEDVPTAPVIGFLVVLEVVSEEEIKVLSPQPRIPQKQYLVQSKVRMLE